MQVNVIKLDAACYLGNSFQNLINLLFEVHVQQPVSLVQHQMLEELETEALQINTPLSLTGKKDDQCIKLKSSAVGTNMLSSCGQQPGFCLSLNLPCC